MPTIPLVMTIAGLALLLIALASQDGRILGINLGRTFTKEERIGLGVLGVLLLGPGVLGVFGIWLVF